MDKWDYFKKINKIPYKSMDKHDTNLGNMLNEYNKMNLQEITLDEAKEYYEKLRKRYLVYD